MAQEKQYGLILPGQKQKPPPVSSKPKNVFGEDSSEEEGSNIDWVKQSLKKQSHGSMQQKQSMKVLKRAIEDDPSVFEYDAVYDEMERTKAETKEKQRSDKKPKYIEGLLKTAKARELENELRNERLAQKERETEGDMYADKEAFVTSAYKLKMEELRKMQEDQAREDAVDELTEVTKQKDLSGFYRYLYKSQNEVKHDSTKPEDRDKDGESNPKEKDRDKDGESNSKERDRVKDGESNPKGRDRDKDSGKNSRDKDRDRDGGRNSRERDRDRGGGRNSRERDRDRDGGKNPRDRDRDRDDGKNPRDRDRDRDGSKTSRDRGRDRDDRNHRHDIDDRRSRKRSRHHEHRSEKGDKSRGGENSENIPGSSASAAAGRDAKLKIIQNENWYDFDVEIEENVNKNFYAKRTVGKAFDEALQKYLLRKGPDQIIDPKSKYSSTFVSMV